MLITIEGNIATGKSTFLKLLDDMSWPSCKATQKIPKPIVVFENVSQWMSTMDPSSGKSVFDLFYEDKKRYAFTFQSFVLLSRTNEIMEAIHNNPDALIFCERGLLTDFEVFGTCLKDSGDLTGVEWEVYKQWHKLVRKVVNVPVAGQIYLRATPEVCKERIKLRNRQSEHLIDDVYLTRLHQRHESWLMGSSSSQLPTLVLNTSVDFVENPSSMQYVVGQIIDFIDGLN
jgi:deoxyadenosine/deoxycytidine kinase